MSDKKIYIDGSGLVLGRLSSWIAQELMAGQQIIVVNSEKIIVSGRRRFLIEDRLQKRARATHTNPTRGPFYPRFPDRILRRTVRVCYLGKNQPVEMHIKIYKHLLRPRNTWKVKISYL